MPRSNRVVRRLDCVKTRQRDDAATFGPIVNGCPCENGPECTAEVWIEGHRPGHIEGLLLSQLNGVWTIGYVQLWWRERERMMALARSREATWVDRRALEEFERSFAACDTELKRRCEEQYSVKFCLEGPRFGKTR
jgi:hypothetical protein